MSNNRLTVPIRDGAEAEHRGYDVFAAKTDVGFHALNGYVGSLRFEPRNGEEVPGHLVTSDPGDPKIITMNIGSTIAEVAALVGDSRKYKAAHGEDPTQLVLSEKALERRQRIVDELVPLLEKVLTQGGKPEMDRLRTRYEEKIRVPLSDVKNKFGVGIGEKTFKGGENLLNESQDSFVFKRDQYVCQLEQMVLSVLRPRLIAAGLLNDGEGEEFEDLAVFFYSDENGLFAEINMPRVAE